MKARAQGSDIRRLADSRFGRIVLFTGARQVGKTTLVQRLLPNYTYLSVEDPQTRGFYEKLTAKEWRESYPRAAIDEVQKAPSIIESIKAVYDQTSDTRYILLGSSQILLMEKVKESLAGRCIIVEFFPLTLPELRTKSFDEPVEKSFWLKLLSGEASVAALPPYFLLLPSMPARKMALDHALTYGGYPAVSDAELSDADRWLWLTNYTRTYLERDLTDLATLRDLEPFLTLRHAVALNTAGILNAESIAKQIGVTAKTVRRYLQYLAIGYQSILLEAWSRNPLRRLTKAPKVHFLDQGVLQVVLGKRGGLTGAEFESFAVSEIYKQCHQQDLPVSFYHLRTHDGFEVDLLVETPKGYYAFEMKMSERVSPTDARHLRALPEILDKPLLHGFVLSRDPETKRLADNITAVHIAMFLG